MNINTNVSIRLKQLRKAVNKSQTEMADELHVEQSTYSRYESGRTQLPLSVIQRISEKYNIDPSEFFLGGNVTVNNDNGSSGNGYVQNYYAVPKELMEKFMSLMESISKRLTPNS
jgi:transcriptional regulator with XRE-family HTH domain